MAKVPLGSADVNRVLAKDPHLFVHNRYYEKNPVLSDDNVSFISRPRLKRFLEVPPGPIRGRLYSQPGSFGDAAFIVSFNTVYRLDTDGTLSNIGTITGADEGTAVEMVATANIGQDVPEYLFIADGGILWVYTEQGFAIGTLSFSGTATDLDTVTIGSIVYKFTAGSVDTGTPDGTAGNPWLVARSGVISTNVTNLANAIRGGEGFGTTYSTATTPHPDVTISNFSGTSLVARAKLAGAGGNLIATTETGANLAWGGVVLAGGGAESFNQVGMPDDVGAISVGYIASFVIVVPAQAEGICGQFYWIEPGESFIDPLNFATAERSPDPIYQVVVYGDKFILPGKSTTETWFVSGDPDAPMQRYQGVFFDRGTAPGTALQIKEACVLVDDGGAVFMVEGGLKRVSTPDIEERIRTALQYQASLA